MVELMLVRKERGNLQIDDGVEKRGWYTYKRTKPG